jgi:hypothetical protein
MTNNLTSAIDRLGVIKAEIADLKTEENALRDVLIEHGPGAYEGKFYRATVSEHERATLDMEAVRAKLSPQFIAAHTLLTDVVTVRVTTRNAAKLKLAERVRA